jgi:hypothetical protein
LNFLSNDGKDEFASHDADSKSLKRSHDSISRGSSKKSSGQNKQANNIEKKKRLDEQGNTGGSAAGSLKRSIKDETKDSQKKMKSQSSNPAEAEPAKGEPKKYKPAFAWFVKEKRSEAEKLVKDKSVNYTDCDAFYI